MAGRGTSSVGFKLANILRERVAAGRYKDRFPTETVFGPAPYAQLRLITCGGTFDYATGHYLSNTIIYAAESP